MTSFARGAATLLSLLAIAGSFAIAQSQDQPARSIPFKTVVPYRGGSMPNPTIPAGGAQAGMERVSPFAFSQLPYTVGSTIAPTTSVPEAEEHIAVDPNNFKNLVAMISDFSLNGGFNTSKLGVSKNNGTSWSQSFVPLSGGFPATADGHVWQANSDPVVAIDKLGNVYLANLYLQVNGAGNVTNDGYYVCSATLASGPVFKQTGCHPVRTSLVPSANLEDKEWIATDNSTSACAGNVYASWTHFVDNTTDEIFFSRSTNHGVTWSAALHIDLAAQDGAVQGSQVAVGPDGAVYVAYEVFLGTGSTGQHFIAKSPNCGKTFGMPVHMTPVFNNLSFSAPYRDNTFPALAVNPKTGFIYDVYTDQPGTSSKTRFVVSTTSGGLAFMAPKTANDSAKGQRLMPAVAADTNGVVHISWFDTRNFASVTSLDIFATYTKDNGVNFAHNARVTSSAILASSGGDFIGDYSGIAAGLNGATSMSHPVWTSAGLNVGGKQQTALLTVP
jgi:hypothetical protein